MSTVADRPDPATLDEATAVVGPLRSHAALAHGRRLGITRGVWRVVGQHHRAVVKVLGATDEPFVRSDWRREIDFYAAGGAPAAYRRAGIRSPELLARHERHDGTVALWLEDVDGGPATAWPVEEYARGAERLGRAQGALAGVARPRWSSQHFVRRYLSLWDTVDFDLLEGPACVHPLADGLAPAGLFARLRRLHDERAVFLEWLEQCPRTWCHLDWWPANLFAEDGTTVAIDWTFTGSGALGEDVGNLVPEAVFDLWLPAAVLGRLDAAVTAAYLAGVRAAGWDGDPRLVRLAMCASAVKYDWLGPHLLALVRHRRERSRGYGGTVVDPVHSFRQRWATLDFLTGWADEARTLAAQLGLPGTG